jgi:glycosyltransferase involved in cell wall biosynthesis
MHANTSAECQKGSSREDRAGTMPTVLYFSSASHVQGGAVQLMFRTARWLNKQGGLPIVVLPREGGIIEWYAKEGIDVHVIPFVELHRRWSLFYLFRYLLSTVSIIIKLVTLMKQQRVDIVHVNEITYFPGLIAGRIAGTKTVCHVRVILEKSIWVRRALSRVAQRFSDRILCESEAVRAWMFPAGASGIRTLYPPGPDPGRFDPEVIGDGATTRQQWGIASDTFVVGLVSKFTPSKGHLALVEAARMIRTIDPDANITYLLVGGEVTGHEDYFTEVCNRIDQYGLKDSCILTGSRNDVPELVSACDVMAHLPQHEDPCPGVVLEAMAMGKPIVAFASGGVPEQFENGRSGILLGKNNVDALVETLLTLVGDETLRLRMGKNARRFLPSRFSEESFFSELSGVYTELLR